MTGEPLRLRDLEEERIDRHRHVGRVAHVAEDLSAEVRVALEGHALREIGQVRQVAENIFADNVTNVIPPVVCNK